MLSAADCEREVRDLHDFFTGYYTGERTDFERVEDALGEGFELVYPSGEIASRESILDAIDGKRGRYEHGEFEIEIRAVEPIEIREERALVRYEEWQKTPDGETGRLSTAYFGPADDETEAAAEWRHLQETWLES